MLDIDWDDNLNPFVIVPDPDAEFILAYVHDADLFTFAEAYELAQIRDMDVALDLIESIEEGDML